MAFFAGAAPVIAVLVLAPAEAPPSSPPSELHLPDGPLRWVALVGGAEPASTQMSLAQDAELLRESLGAGGALLFAGGTGSFVQVRAASTEPPSLRARLAELFDPRDREVRYVPGPRAEGPATAAAVFAVLDALRGPDEPFTWVLSGHGEGGDAPADSLFQLWGGEALGVVDLAEELDALGRPARLVVTSCFGGGFAEILFVGGSPDAGVATPLRCGVFATTYDREASGCDPNPARAAQDSYALHFGHALRGHDREGRPIDLDLDGDGRVGLLEAHTHARIAARSLDVPTTTSERFLAHLVETIELDEVEADLSLPELAAEGRVIRELGAALGALTEPEARVRVERAEHVLENEEVALAEVEGRSDDAFFALRIRVLERLPIADDPWHPALDEALVRDADGMLALLTTSPEAIEHAAAVAALEEAHARVDDARVEAAIRWRLLQAWDTARLATAVERHGGPSWETFVALRACEAGVP